MMEQISELYSVVAEWAVKNGAVRIDQTPGVWSGETPDYEVKVNPHREEIDGMAFGQVNIIHKTLFAKLAVVFPNGGEIVGVSESDLIDHFRSEANRASQ